MTETYTPVLINLGDTIPDVPDIRLGTWVGPEACAELGEDECPEGGYLVWNSGSDWFVVPVDEVVGVADFPTLWSATSHD